MKRFEDDYQREPRRRADPRDARIESRDDRHGRDRVQARDRRELVDDRMDTREPRVDPRDRMDTVVDARMPTSRIDPARANDAARLQPRTDRYGVETRERAPPPPELYKDPRTGALRDARTGELYEEIPPRGTRGYDDRTDRGPMDRDRMERDDIPPPTSTRRTREVVDHAPPARGYEDDEFHRGTTKYNDYFVPGTGIDREVIQHEICRYLGNDATVRPFTNKDGRQGYVVRAYRALTSAMIEDLKRDSARWRTEQDRRQRSGRSTGSYADMKGREEVLAEPVDVDMDDYDRPARSRHDDPRREPSGRHGVPAVSSGYPPEPGYYVSSNQPSNYGPETLPRSHQDYRNPGNSTPPTTTRPGQPGYSQAGYPPRTTATAPPASIPSYRDPRTGQLISGYEPSYPAEPRRRHQ